MLPKPQLTKTTKLNALLSQPNSVSVHSYFLQKAEPQKAPHKLASATPIGWRNNWFRISMVNPASSLFTAPTIGHNRDLRDSRLGEGFNHSSAPYMLYTHTRTQT